MAAIIVKNVDKNDNLVTTVFFDSKEVTRVQFFPKDNTATFTLSNSEIIRVIDVNSEQIYNSLFHNARTEFTANQKMWSY